MRLLCFLFLVLTGCADAPQASLGSVGVPSVGSEPGSVDSGVVDTGADTGAPTGSTPTDTGSTFQSGTVVEVASGALEGVEEGDLRVFRGIPYAAPPVGSLRLRDPEPVASWSGVRDASRFGAACPQSTVALLDWLSQTDDTDEDCLFLNVWAHNDGETDKPVMVWVHGGAFFYGAGSQDLYDASAIAMEDVVVVSINYRLGALGFLAHPELGAQVGNDNPGNFGLKDQILALEWVQENIAAFGGDPENVTVFGESAGAISACILATLPATDGLMHKVIGQSIVGCHALPTATTAGAIGGSAPIDQAEDAVRSLGCEGASDMLACLQDLPADRFVDLVQATSLLSDPTSSFPMPYVDGSFVAEPPADVYARGEADLPMIVGTTADEATLFLGLSAPLTWLSMDDAITEVLGTDAYTDDVLDLYTVWDYPFPQEAFLTFGTDAMFSCPTRSLADAAAPGAPVYLYEFQERSLTTLALGSHHALDIPYVFGTFDSMGIVFPSDSDVALGQAMRSAWTEFARTGDPNASGATANDGPSTVGWTPWAPGGSWMRFDDHWSTMRDASYRDGRCEGLGEVGLGLLEVH